MSAIPRLPAFRALLLLSAILSQVAAQSPVVRLIAWPRDAKDIFSRSTTIVRPLDDELLQDWRAAKEEARAAGVQILILEITASAGRRHVLSAIAEDLADLRASGVRIAAWVPEKATGPGALLALEADTLILSADANIGDANPALMEGTGSANAAATAREVLAQAQAAARRAGHPVIFVDAMVDPDVEIWEVRRTGMPSEFVTSKDIGTLPREGVSREVVERKGETLVLDAVQATRFGFPVKMAESRDDLLRALGLEDRKLSSSEVIKLKAKEVGTVDFFRLDWTLILLAAGILFLILELKTPGIGINGILGIALLAGYFLTNAGAGGVDAAITIGLLLLGFLLLLVEVLFFPGFGVPGILGVALIFLSIYAASIGLPGDNLREQLIPDSNDDFLRLQAWFIQVLGAIVTATLGALLIAPQLHRFPLFNRAFLAPAIAGAGTAAGAGAATMGVSAQGRVRLDVGARGTSETDLRPAGLARIGEHRVDVVTDGEYVAKGTPIVITAIEGHRVVVKAHQA